MSSRRSKSMCHWECACVHVVGEYHREARAQRAPVVPFETRPRAVFENLPQHAAELARGSGAAQGLVVLRGERVVAAGPASCLPSARSSSAGTSACPAVDRTVRCRPCRRPWFQARGRRTGASTCVQMKSGSRWLYDSAYSRAWSIMAACSTEEGGGACGGGPGGSIGPAAVRVFD